MSTTKLSPEAAREQRLQQLRAFGLFVEGSRTLYQIAERLGIAEQNPSTAAGRARTRIEQGWRIVKALPRWELYKTYVQPIGLSGARLSTHPRAEPEPPLTPFESLLKKISALEVEAADGGFDIAASALKNLRIALRYNEEHKENEHRKSS